MQNTVRSSLWGALDAGLVLCMDSVGDCYDRDVMVGSSGMTLSMAG